MFKNRNFKGKYGILLPFLSKKVFSTSYFAAKSYSYVIFKKGILMNVIVIYTMIRLLKSYIDRRYIFDEF